MHGHAPGMLPSLPPSPGFRALCDVRPERQQNGQTALSVAAQSGHVEVVQWLLAREGLDVTALDGKGSNALLHAVTTGSPEIVQRLLGVPAMTGVEADDRGRTALIQAACVLAGETGGGGRAQHPHTCLRLIRTQSHPCVLHGHPLRPRCALVSSLRRSPATRAT